MKAKLVDALCWLCIFLAGSALVFQLAFVKGGFSWQKNNTSVIAQR